MKLIARTAESNIATVYIACIGDKKIEFVESVQPPFKREDKWVMIISTMFGCPVGCSFCDSGGDFKGSLSKSEMFAQIDYLVTQFFEKEEINTSRLKIQFARMGEPALNNEVLGVLRELNDRYRVKGEIMPSFSTIAPAGREGFFHELMAIKNEYYGKNFQMQFSIHSTDEEQRNSLIPIKKWCFRAISDFGNKFHKKDERKITLNFAISPRIKVEPGIIADNFSTEKFLIKVTPVNPSYSAVKNGIESHDLDYEHFIVEEFMAYGFDVIHSIGEPEENRIGSNCGQYVSSARENVDGSYSYGLIDL